MNFKVPESILYFAIGINCCLLFFGIALDSMELSALAVLNGALCAFPLVTKKDNEEE